MKFIKQQRRRQMGGEYVFIRMFQNEDGSYRIESKMSWGWVCSANYFDNLDQETADRRFNEFGSPAGEVVEDEETARQI